MVIVTLIYTCVKLNCTSKGRKSNCKTVFKNRAEKMHSLKENFSIQNFIKEIVQKALESMG